MRRVQRIARAVPGSQQHPEAPAQGQPWQGLPCAHICRQPSYTFGHTDIGKWMLPQAHSCIAFRYSERLAPMQREQHARRCRCSKHAHAKVCMHVQRHACRRGWHACMWGRHACRCRQHACRCRSMPAVQRLQVSDALHDLHQCRLRQPADSTRREERPIAKPVSSSASSRYRSRTGNVRPGMASVPTTEPLPPW